MRSSRHSQITDEHLVVDPALLGRALASPWRRAGAMAIDGALVVALGTPWLILIVALALQVQAPAVLALMVGLLQAPEERSATLWSDAQVPLAELVAKRRPDLFLPEIHQALEAGDEEAIHKALGNASFQLQVESARNWSSYDRGSDTYHLRADVLLGPTAPVVGGLSFVLLYFTALIWKLRGLTVGKWIAGICVVRLDGQPLTLWDAFGRAGGYSASVSTLGLGFFEAFWHSNRQALHDRISGTVVVRRAPRNLRDDTTPPQDHSPEVDALESEHVEVESPS